MTDVNMIKTSNKYNLLVSWIRQLETLVSIINLASWMVDNLCLLAWCLLLLLMLLSLDVL